FRTAGVAPPPVPPTQIPIHSPNPSSNPPVNNPNPTTPKVQVTPPPQPQPKNPPAPRPANAGIPVPGPDGNMARASVLQTADQLSRYNWVCAEQNRRAPCIRGVNYQSDWLPNQRVAGLPYNWGGADG